MGFEIESPIWKHPPFVHQTKMAQWHYDHRRSLDVSDVGCGKTLGAIAALQQWFNEGEISSVLIVAPASVLSNWENELKKWSDIRSVILRGDKDTRLKLLNSNAQAFLINYEGINSIYPQLLECQFKAIICDECHRIKSSQARQSKQVIALSKLAEIKIALTGTLITNDLQDVWSICHFINPGIFSTNSWGFRARYMHDRNAGLPWKKWPEWAPRPGAVEEVRKKIEPHAIRFLKKDILPWLPPVLFQQRSVELGPEQRRIYRELRREFIADLDNGNVLIAADILPRVSKLVQITSGFLYVPDQPTYNFSENAKLTELKNVLESLGENRAIIWTAFKECSNLISTALKGQSYDKITGETPIAVRQEIIDRFNANQIQWLICATQCASEGLTILAPYAIYYSRSWKLGDRLQSLGRNDRPGSEQFPALTVIDLVCSNTLDTEILAALNSKEDLLRSINPKRFRELI